MYSFPININHRRKFYLELHNNASEPNLTDFIVEVPSLSQFPLLEINLGNSFIAFENGNFDLAISKFKIETNYESDNFCINFYPNDIPLEAPKKVNSEQRPEISYDNLEDLIVEDKEIPKNSSQNFHREQIGSFNENIQLQVLKGENIFSLEGNCIKQIKGESFDKEKLIVQFKLHINGNVYQNNLVFYLVHPSQFLGIALDYGSEASQLAFKRYKTDFVIQAKKPEVENLFAIIKNYHIGKNIIDQENVPYFQEEKGTTFYKSIFFVKKDLEGDYTDFRKKHFLEKSESNLKMLVKNKPDVYEMLKASNFEQLPNIKIIHKHHEVLKDFNFNIFVETAETDEQGNLTKKITPLLLSIDDIRPKVHNSILKTMLSSFLTQEKYKYFGEKRYIRFVLLVPNIYDAEDVLRLQNEMRHLFEDLKQNEFKDFILAYELMNISESDASFIGYMTENNTSIQNDKDYIIVDVGKGTTDFSILKTGKTNSFDVKPVYRNGFAGAGNLITFAVFETVLHFLRENTNYPIQIKNFIRKNILEILASKDLGNKSAFFELIEKLKKKYSPQKEIVYENWKNNSYGNLNFYNLAEDGNFSGLIKLLENLENISDFYGYIDDACSIIVNQTTAYLKIVKENSKEFNQGGVILTGRGFCFNPLAQKMRDALSQELGFSNITLLQGNGLKEICIKGVFNNSIFINTEIVGQPIQLFNKPTQTIVEKPKKNLMGKLMSTIFNDISKLDEVEKYIPVNNKLDFEKLRNSQILIGSKKYILSGSNFFTESDNTNAKATINITRNGYRVRKLLNNQVVSTALLEDAEQFSSDTNNTTVLASLFPNGILESNLSSMNIDIVAKNKTEHQVNPIDNSNNPYLF